MRHTIASVRRNLKKLNRATDKLYARAADVRKRGRVPFLHDRQLLQLQPGEKAPEGAVELLPEK
jgi:hypothetical protein